MAMMIGRPARRPLTKSALESGLMLTSTEGSSFGSAVMSQSARQCQRIRLKVASAPLKRRGPNELLGGAGADPDEPCRLVDHLDAEFGRLLELGAGTWAGDDEVGLLRHRAGNLGAEPLGHRLRLLARHPLERTGEHNGLAGDRRGERG